MIDASSLLSNDATDVVGMIIGGELRGETQTFNTYDPCTGTVLAQVAESSISDIEDAVETARAALSSKAWGSMQPADRTSVLLRTADLVEQHSEQLAQLETRNNGMPLSAARGAVSTAIDHLKYFAGWPTKIAGEVLPISNERRWLNFTRHEPVGVVGGIVAWNTPIDNAIWKLVAPLAVGCSVILKPAEQTPLTALYLARLFVEAGVPPEAISVLTGAGSVGAALASHSGVDKIAFTGSTHVGREIVRASAGNLKRLSLELGGKSPAIVLADADLELAADGLLRGIFHNAGQICCASSRIIVEEAIAGRLVDAIAARASRLVVGPGLDPASEMGPLISADQLERVVGYVESAIGHARLVTGGQRMDGSGYFFEPTIFDNVSDDLPIAREEIFGPVLAITASPASQLIDRANDTRYGLSASVWTRDISRALRIVEQLQAGVVWINGHTVLDNASPFGGVKESGYGRELGREVLEGYLSTKSIWINYEPSRSDEQP